MDRLMTGEMSLWEVEAAVSGFNQNQPLAPGEFRDDGAPEPTEADWVDLMRRTEQTVGSVH